MPIPTAPTTAVAGQPARASAQFNAVAGQTAFLMGNLPILSLRQAVAQSIPTGALTPITFDTSIVDRDAAHSITTNTDRFIPQTPGFYWVTGIFAITGNVTGTRIAEFSVNGGQVLGGAVGAAGASSSQGLQVTILQPFNGTTDYLQLVVFQNSGAALSTLVSTDFQCSLRAVWVSQ